VIVSALRQFVATEEAKPRGFERIELSFEDADDHDLRSGRRSTGSGSSLLLNPWWWRRENPEAYNSAWQLRREGKLSFTLGGKTIRTTGATGSSLSFVFLAVAAADPS